MKTLRRTKSRIVFATLSHLISSIDTLKMYWIAECGHDGLDHPGLATQCPGCGIPVNVPSTPKPADVDGARVGTVRDADTQLLARILRNYMTAEQVAELVHALGTPPPATVKIENYTAGSPEDIAASLRFGVDHTKNRGQG